MVDLAEFERISPTTLAEVLGPDCVMDGGLRPLWAYTGRLAGPAFTVHCQPGDNLMLHAAIYRAQAGSVLVVESGTLEYAVAGGNVCAIAQRHGVAGLVVDGVIRDLAEVRESGFPVFARGVIPIPGAKRTIEPLKPVIRCGGVTVRSGDIVVADEEGIVVTPAARAEEVLREAKARSAREESQTLDQWEAEHRARVDQILSEGGFRD